MSAPKGRKDKVMYCNKFGFTLYQQNGQRTYGGPPPNWGSRPPPSRDCEVFIGRLPRMCFEDELIPLFLTAGELYEFRLMLHFSGQNRGFGYAHYATLAGAQRAIENLNKFEIRPGHHIGVLKSKNNCRLLFGNIKSGMDINAFNEFIRTATDQVLNVLMFKNFQQLKQTDFRISSEVEEAFLSRVPRNGGNNQFAIVEYENHKAAAVARRVLIPKYGHVLAIDWAVPPREKKRFVAGVDANLQAIERPLSCAPMKDSNLVSIAKSFSKVRPVPTLLVQASIFDDVSFMPKNLKIVVKFFKYQLSVCLYKSVNQLEIPLFICKEIEKKIVDRITNLENCGQAVQLIFNYFSWYNEKKRFGVHSETQKLLQEVKLYADSFVVFINKKLKFGQPSNSSEDNYYTHILPLHLSILFRIILHSDLEQQIKLSSGITQGLKWLMNIMQKNDQASKDFIEEIVLLNKTEDGPALDKATAVAKNSFLKTVGESHQEVKSNALVDPRANSQGYGVQLSSEMGGKEAIKYNRAFYENDWAIRMEENRFLHFSGFENLEESTLDAYPPVPLLVVRPSIVNKVPFMPDIYNNVLTYFKHLIRVCLNLSACQMNIPQIISSEIEMKIIDRISNMENCSEGVQLILNYLSLWIEKRPCSVNLENQKLLHEVKIYADSFVDFIFTRTMSVYVPDEAAEDYFCKVLPLRLNLLYQMMLIFNTENSMRFFIGISKGLKWLEELIQKGDPSAKEFLENLTRFIIELDSEAYEKAKRLGKVFCAEMMASSGQAISQYPDVHPFLMDVNGTDRISTASSVGTSNGVSVSGSDNASVSTLDYDF